ncbi:hypothetical protein AX16_009350 [Volvariella volvacea WC 439]|nr:hypothetical protein AX16_009350 [Volvariella volvacea WC 439]
MLRLVDDFFHANLVDPPKTWYGAEFKQEDLPYDSDATRTLAVTHPYKPASPLSERSFWDKHIPKITLRYSNRLSRTLVVGQTSSNTETRSVAPVAPINNLPVEVLRSMLGYATLVSPFPIVPEVEQHIRKLRCRLDLNPLLLGQVCHHWREIVCSMPKLWSTIRLHNPRVAQARLAELYLVRSGQHAPLTLSIQQSLLDQTDLLSQAKSLHIALWAFVKQIHRWRGINFKIFATGESNPLLDSRLVEPGVARILEIAHLDFMGWKQEWIDRVLACLGTSSVLRDVSFCLVQQVEEFASWTRLTRLQFIDVPPDVWSPVLPLLGELQALRFHFYTTDTFDIDLDQVATLPKLRSIELEGSEVSDILKYIAAPTLKELHLNYYTRIQDPREIGLQGFLTRSGCTLTSFTLSTQCSGTKRHQESILRYFSLKGLQKIEFLRLNINIGDIILAVIDAGLFPQLKEVTLPQCDATDGRVGIMVQKRMKGEEKWKMPPTEVIRIGLLSHRNVIDEVMITNLQMQGYQVELMHSRSINARPFLNTLVNIITIVWRTVKFIYLSYEINSRWKRKLTGECVNYVAGNIQAKLRGSGHVVYRTTVAMLAPSFKGSDIAQLPPILRIISDAFHRQVGDPPMTWYGAEFSQDCLPYDPGVTKALSITYPSTPCDINSERVFWIAHIPDYESKFPSTPSEDFVPEFAFPEYVDADVFPSVQINDLPEEILRRILGFAAVPASVIDISGQLHLQRRINYRLDLSPLFLGQVCSTWRGIVRFMPTLWSTIRLYIPGKAQAHLAELYLIRSGPITPLTLSIRYPGVVFQTDKEALRIVISAFGDQIHRWRGIDLRLPFFDSDTLLDHHRVRHGATEILETLHLQMTDGGTREHELIEILSMSPALKDVSINCPTLTEPSKLWSQLTHLYLAPPSLRTVHPILHLLQELQVLRFVLGPFLDTLWIGGPEIEATILPKLHTLELGCSSATQLLAYITTPALKSLDISQLSVCDPAEIKFREFLERSQCSITSFALSGPLSWTRSWQRRVGVVKYLATPELQSVERINITGDVDNVVVALLAMGLFPSLKELVLARCQASDGLVSTMIQKRMQGDGSPGRTLVEVIKVVFMRRRNYFDEAKIRKMRKKGYNVEMVASKY